MYWSKYPQPFITRLASQLRQIPRADEVWCVFDNTASGSAVENALELRNRVANATMSSVVPE
jgi:uncharacterized protein YecE (DUF72 family)